MVKYDLDGRVIFITGGATGIGKATAEECAANGARVVISGSRIARLDPVVQEITAAGGDRPSRGLRRQPVRGCRQSRGLYSCRVRQARRGVQLRRHIALASMALSA
jgi:NAD(P)-dependent dehydrogenase (short-subunit alcohol dehydrogenase family)